MCKLFLKAVFNLPGAKTANEAILYTHDFTSQELNKKHIDLYITSI